MIVMLLQPLVNMDECAGSPCNMNRHSALRSARRESLNVKGFGGVALGDPTFNVSHLTNLGGVGESKKGHFTE